MKFRRKPIEETIEAKQFLLDSDRKDWPEGVVVHEGRHGVYTLSGFRHVNNKDWVITNPTGDLCVCTREAFEDLWEPVE